MTPADAHHRLDTDLAFFNEHANVIVQAKSGENVPFRFNRAQRYIHDKLEEQRRLRGWVRALLVKGRQQGGTTYIQDRFFHKIMRGLARRALVLSHESKTTDNIFAMVRRFYENLRAEFKPEIGADNPRQMSFPGLDATYLAATAGNEQAARGTTSQLLHGSEAAYWKEAYAILDAALQSIAMIAGTEIILESTANGPAGLFYDMCLLALKGLGDFVLIFVPWFWQDEYEREVEPTFTPTEDEELYAAANFARPFPYSTNPISRGQVLRKLAWRRAKILEAGGGHLEAGQAKFRAIYPANPVEAFLSTAVGIVRAEAITAARAAWHKHTVDEFAPRVAGVDPAGDGKRADRTVITIRQGRRIEEIVRFPKMRPMELAGIVARLINERNLDMVFIDRGYGEGTIDRLRELGFGRKVIGVAFNEKPLNPVYVNKRSEIMIECAKWINAGDGVAIPDDDEVHADFAAIPLDRETSNGLKYMASKDEIVKAFGRSYDIFDSAALTFAYPVRREGAGSGGERWRKAEKAVGGGPLSSMNRRRARG